MSEQNNGSPPAQNQQQQQQQQQQQRLNPMPQRLPIFADLDFTQPPSGFPSHVRVLMDRVNDSYTISTRDTPPVVIRRGTGALPPGFESLNLMRHQSRVPPNFPGVVGIVGEPIMAGRRGFPMASPAPRPAPPPRTMNGENQTTTNNDNNPAQTTGNTAPDTLPPAQFFRVEINNNIPNSPGNTDIPILNGNNLIPVQQLRHKSKKASDDAIRQLKEVDPNTLPEGSRSCPVCYEGYDKSSNSNEDLTLQNIEKVKEIRLKPINSDPVLWFPVDPTGRHHAEYKRFYNTEEEDSVNPTHQPVEMPCGHVFGRSCLVEWLKNHTSCPLCRKEVEEAPTSLLRAKSYAPVDWSSDLEPIHSDPSVAFPISSMNSRRRATMDNLNNINNFGTFFGNDMRNYLQNLIGSMEAVTGISTTTTTTAATANNNNTAISAPTDPRT